MLSTLVLALLPILSQAQDYGYGAPVVVAPSSTSTSMAVMATMAPVAPAPVAAAPASAGVHSVTVGLGGLIFNPNNISAAIGDTVVFQFHPKMHSVSQSSFATPCYHLADASGMAIGLDSGYVPVGVNDTTFPTFTVKVDVTTPLWFFCNQGPHCSEGMVFAINAPTTGNTVDQFISNAKNLAATPTVSLSISEALRTAGTGAEAMTPVSAMAATASASAVAMTSASLVATGTAAASAVATTKAAAASSLQTGGLSALFVAAVVGLLV